ncbi:hypothetical protein LY76DRAFT_215494 [Colletotrichum caudatum]|nr:hypothetical protein LY76DRAFT_215494 [Colletotrichum caudatum]
MIALHPLRFVPCLCCPLHTLPQQRHARPLITAHQHHGWPDGPWPFAPPTGPGLSSCGPPRCLVCFLCPDSPRSNNNDA